jgi:hypothetical protein
MRGGHRHALGGAARGRGRAQRVGTHIAGGTVAGSGAPAARRRGQSFRGRGAWPAPERDAGPHGVASSAARSRLQPGLGLRGPCLVCVLQRHACVSCMRGPAPAGSTRDAARAVAALGHLIVCTHCTLWLGCPCSACAGPRPRSHAPPCGAAAPAARRPPATPLPPSEALARAWRAGGRAWPAPKCLRHAACGVRHAPRGAGGR